MAQLQELSTLTIIVRIVLALIIGGIIGMEREIKHRPAGFRTYALVCLGATIVMMTNQYVNDIFKTGDPTRLGAQVISGIGFLGAGTIMVTRKSQVRGLTTAAGLWTAACTGLAIGIGFYEGAIAAGIAIIFIMVVFEKIDTKIVAQGKILRVYAIFESLEYFNEFTELCKSRGIVLSDMQLSKDNIRDKTSLVVILTLENKKRGSHTEILSYLSQAKGLKYIEELQ